MVAWRKDHVTVLVPTSCLSMKKDNSLFLYIYECGSRNSDWKRLNHRTSSLKKLAVIHRSLSPRFISSFFHSFVIHLYISVWHSDGTQFLVHTSLSSCVINGRTACLEDRKRHKGDISQSRLYPDIIWTNLRGSWRLINRGTCELLPVIHGP